MNKPIEQQVKVFQTVLEEIPEITYAGDPVLRNKTEETSLK